MKRLKLVIIVLMVLSLTGCVKKYTATDEQSDAIAEYMAGLLLDNDKQYDQALIPEDELNSDGSDTSEDSNTVTQAPSPTKPAGDAPSGTEDSNSPQSDSNTSSLSSLSEVIGNDSFQIDYKSFKLTDQYKSEYFVLNPRDGYRLMVISFSIKNISGDKQIINLTKAGIEYEITGKSGTKYAPLLTLLENDLQYINIEIGAGKTKGGVLIFQVPDQSEISGEKLDITNEDKTAEITIK